MSNGKASPISRAAMLDTVSFACLTLFRISDFELRLQCDKQFHNALEGR